MKKSRRGIIHNHARSYLLADLTLFSGCPTTTRNRQDDTNQMIKAVGMPSESVGTGTSSTKRALMRYIASVEELKSALLLAERPGWEAFNFPEFEKVPETEESMLLLQEAIEERLAARAEAPDEGLWQKGQLLAQRLFVASTPFVKNALVLSKAATQSVRTLK
jgi:hypothetical protein